jgi:hypothetical protein
MGRMIDIDVLFDYFGNDAIDKTTRSNIEYFVSEKGTVEAIPKEEVIGILEEVKKQLKDMRTDFYEQGHKDVSFGINIGMEEIARKIFLLEENEDGNK